MAVAVGSAAEGDDETVAVGSAAEGDDETVAVGGAAEGDDETVAVGSATEGDDETVGVTAGDVAHGVAGFTVPQPTMKRASTGRNVERILIKGTALRPVRIGSSDNAIDFCIDALS